MALSVAPTSGDGPYVVSADVSNSHSIDGIHYYATVETSVSGGNCPLSGSGEPWSAFNVGNLISGQSVTTSYPNVPDGSCRTISLRIRRVIDDSVLDISNVSIDNI